MSGNVLERGTAGLLVLIIPVAFTAVFLYAAWPYLLALLAIAIAFSIWQSYAWQKFSAKINPTFNRLVRENQGCLTPLDLAATANLNASAAKRYLEKKSQEYGAQRQEIPNRGSVYYFLTASSLGSILDASEPLLEGDDEILIEAKALEGESQSASSLLNEDGSLANLIQADLAKRLNVKDYKISRYKTNDDFSEWSKQLDPEGIGWTYRADDKMFIPQT